jgi:hypothetical protein
MPSNPLPAVAPNGETGRRIRVLLFSRGRGRGHAVPDIAIAGELPGLDDRIEIQFASYATGAETFRRAGRPVIDLGLPEANAYTPTLLLAHKLIAELRPDIVVAHEEFAVLPAARMAGIPSVLLTDWFPPPAQVTAETITYADAIIFMGEPGIFPLPAMVRRPPVFVSPVIRKMQYALSDRPRARAELGIAEAALVVSVIPGAWATEEKAPIAQIVLPAFRLLAPAEKCLFWLTKTDQPQLQKLAQGDPQVRVLADHPVVEQLMVASDVIITKGNRGTIMDAASLGVPSISLSLGTNPVDEILISKIRSNLAFNARAMDAPTLRRYIEQQAAIPLPERTPPPDLSVQGGAAAAKALIAEINRLLPSLGRGASPAV